MDRENWFNRAENDFFDVIVKGGGLDDLSDVAYKYLGNPVLITNERGIIFGKAKDNPPYDDPMFEENHEKGYVPREKFALTSVEIFADKMQNGRIIILDKAFVQHRLMIYQDYIGNDFILKFVMLESKRPFSATDEQMFELFAKTVRYFLLNSTLVRSFRSNSVEFFFYESLIGHIDCAKNEHDVKEYLGVSAGDRRSLLVARNIYSNARPVTLAEIRIELESIFSKCISIIDGDYIVLLIRSENINGFNENLKKSTAYFRRNNMRGCVSRVFESLRELPQIYKNLKDALELGTRISSNTLLFHAGDLDSFCLFYQQNDNILRSNCYLPVLELLDADRSGHHSLMMTLYAYCLTFGSITKTAQLLGIHYNSLKLRLSKIKEILKISVDEMLPALYISIVILLLKEFDKTEKYLLINQLLREQNEKGLEVRI